MKFRAWISALRLRTLPLALSTVGMGSFIAVENKVFDNQIFIWAILTTVLLQILSNLANDYGDSQNGADNNLRVGPERAVQSGKISTAEMKYAIVVFVVLSFISGVKLLDVALGFASNDFFVFLGFGVLSIIAAYTYTAGKRPYGYAGLGDIMVLIFFGLLGVAGSYYLFSTKFTLDILLPALSLGFLATGVLNINNMRDVEADKNAKKNTIPVRYGRENAVRYHWFLLLGALIASASYLVLHGLSLSSLIWFLGVPMVVLNGVKVSRAEKRVDLDPFLRHLAISTFLFMIFSGLAMVL